MSQRFAQTQANAELGEVLRGLKRCCDALGQPYPEMVVVDNCCHVRSEILKVFPGIDVSLDVWHFMRR